MYSTYYLQEKLSKQFRDPHLISLAGRNSSESTLSLKKKGRKKRGGKEKKTTKETMNYG